MSTPKVLLIGLLVLVGMLAMLELGRRIGISRLRADPLGARAGVGAVEGAVFGLFGLLLAFTFSGAASRFEARRDLVATEANAIGTAYLRLEVLPEKPRLELKQKMRRYVDGRIETYRLLPDVEAAHLGFARSIAQQQEIWLDAVAALHDIPGSAMEVLLPALNVMNDITMTRLAKSELHPPPIIFAMMGALSLLAALLAGQAMCEGKRRHLLHMVVYAVVTAFSFYVILDLEYPRLGLIRVDDADQVLVLVRRGME